MVLKGETGTAPGTPPTIIPELQNRSVISVAYGRDDIGPVPHLNAFMPSNFDAHTSSHFGALTSSGKLLAWGKDSSGALGFGDARNLPPEGTQKGVKSESMSEMTT